MPITISTTKILIIDDSLLLCKILRDSLANTNTDVVIANTGSEGLNLAITNKFDLILLDVVLPDIDGYTVCSSLKNNKCTTNIPIVFITSSTNEKDILHGFEVGATDYICKPFSNYELRARALTHLKNKLMTDQLRVANEELAKALEQNRILAVSDPLTNLFNRRYVQESLDNLFANLTKDKPCAILLADIDSFKNVNDTYGHGTGDLVLVKVAEVLKKTLPQNAIVGRWGGEEFIAVIPSTNIEEAYIAGKNTCKAIADYDFKYQGQIIKCSITIGCSMLEEVGGIRKSISIADALLYKGKCNGKNQCVC